MSRHALVLLPSSRLDPRTHVVLGAAGAGAIVCCSRLSVLGVALAAAVAAVVAARTPLADLRRRLVPLNTAVLALFVLLPLTAPGERVALGPVSLSEPGIRHAFQIALKANAVVLLLVATLGGLHEVTLGQALQRLAVPRRLTALLLFTVRYIDVLRSEYARLRRAMQLRAFRPGTNGHTYRAMGYLFGMLLVRSLDRSERIMAAMKCRGFRGEFHALQPFRFTGIDVAVSILGLAGVGALLYLEHARWLP